MFSQNRQFITYHSFSFALSSFCTFFISLPPSLSLLPSLPFSLSLSLSLSLPLSLLMKLMSCTPQLCASLIHFFLCTFVHVSHGCRELSIETIVFALLLSYNTCSCPSFISCCSFSFFFSLLLLSSSLLSGRYITLPCVITCN